MVYNTCPTYEEFEPELTQREKELRDRFVVTYFDDYDYLAACVRIGFPKALAVDWAVRFKYDTYVQSRIAEAERQISEDPDSNIERVKARVINALMREAHYLGPDASHNARVNALGKLAQIQGMEAPKRIEQNVNHSGSIVHNFDFSKLTKEQQELYRTLLTSLVEAGNEPES